MKPRKGGLGATTTTCSPLPGAETRVCITRPAKRTKVHTADDACTLLRRARNADRESFYVLALDPQNQVQGVEEIARGSVGDVAVHPREAFKTAVMLNASAVIIAHNHPSGSPVPSELDVDLTKRFVEAGKLLGIPVIDHLIVGQSGCGSIADVDPMVLRGARRPARRYRIRRR